MSDEPHPSRQLPVRLLAGVFVLVFALLALGYVLFLRPLYVPVFSKLRQADAAAVAKQLDAKSISYRLADDGTTVLVPSDQTDQARVAVAGSDVALNGGVGFELFNKSDMGLTDFAQRINYQRALQGELERTIMMMDEIETARVHLAMPERALFRSERNPSKAAVEIIAKPGKSLDGDRVAGIRRLVAFSVPDLVATDVVVVDADGRVLSQSAVESTDGTLLAPDAEERQAVQRYYRARVRAALEPALPGVQMDVKVVALDKEAVGSATVPEPFPARTPIPKPTPLPTPLAGATPNTAVSPAETSASAMPRDFRLRIIVATPLPLNEEQRTMARNLAAAAVGLDEASGDELTFQLGAAVAADGASPPLPVIPPATPSMAAAPGMVSPETGAAGWSYWWIAAIAAIAALALLALQWLRPVPRLSPAERDAMIERTRAALRAAETADA